MRYTAVVSFYNTLGDPAHSLNVMNLDTARHHVEDLMNKGFTVFTKQFDDYSKALTWANKYFHAQA